MQLFNQKILLFILIHHDVHGIAGNDKLFVCSDDRYLDLGIREGYQGVLARCHVGLVVELESEIGKVLANPPAEPAVVLSDSS